MKNIKKAMLLTITAVSAISMTAVVLGQGRGAGRPTPDQQAVHFRQSLMTVVAGEGVPLILMQRGRMPFKAAEVEKNARNLVTLAGIIPDAFERNTSSATNVKTEALPVVWQNHDEFLMDAMNLRTQAEAVEKAAKGGNETEIKAAIKNMGAACGQCHMKFRMMD